MDVPCPCPCPHSLQELKLWVRQLQPEGGSNLLRALKKVFALRGLDSLVVVLGSWYVPVPERVTGQRPEGAGEPNCRVKKDRWAQLFTVAHREH